MPKSSHTDSLIHSLDDLNVLKYKFSRVSTYSVKRKDQQRIKIFRWDLAFQVKACALSSLRDQLSSIFSVLTAKHGIH
ncbi:hypothetical protein ARC63_03575 [Stenotrophomonas geniculata ATCC 19374 = JCM 13324]|nr:hypothetical protein ARC63_03575 [Stenotrophomonas geniculata ATCC 19374 = JCM 13324]